MIIRIALVFAVTFIVVWGIKQLAKFALKRWLMSMFPSPQQPQEATLQEEKLVRCTFCQIFIPQSEAIYQHERYYCSASHSQSRS